MRQSENVFAPLPPSRAVTLRNQRSEAVIRQAFAIAPPRPMPVSRIVKSRLSQLFGMLLIPCVFASGGYLANDAAFRKAAIVEFNLAISTGVTEALPTADGGDLSIGLIPQQALSLFGDGKKGPRADRYFVEASFGERPRQGPFRINVEPPAGTEPESIQRRTKSAPLTLVANAAVQDNEAARPENTGLMANASFFMMQPGQDDGLFDNLAANTRSANKDEVWAELVQNASLSADETKTIFGGLTEDEFRERELRCMATAVYFEARGEPEKGQAAVAQVIMNRIRSPIYPKTICGVIYQGHLNRNSCQFSFACDGKHDRATNKQQWATALKISKQVLARDIWVEEIGYATHYHADYVKPDWRKLYERVTKIGVHIFYKTAPGAVQVALAVE